ncbi:hypothetical protein [Levilactobacillus humaensis]|uniref:hypothetical protein n=1 Tax=Levilactobacillus humaensis TaxID=2950375 RepID=UPI0021C36E16|nr:hypothetical protein [Levilactobacillus humaensis]
MNKLKSTILTLTAILGLGIIAPAIPAINHPVTAQASAKVVTVKIKYWANADVEVGMESWLYATFSNKIAKAIIVKADVAYNNTYAKTKSPRAALIAMMATIKHYTGVKFKIIRNDYVNGSNAIDRSKAKAALKNTATAAQVSAAVAPEVNQAVRNFKVKQAAYAYKVSKLTSTKTKSNQAVTVMGTVAVHNRANAKKSHAKWARITTYKGYKFVRLSQQGTFKATIKAPKAKKTWARAGYYTKKMKRGQVVKKNGKIVYIFHLLSGQKKVTVQPYKA